MTLWLISSTLAALAVAALAWLAIDIATRPRVIDPALGRFELERRQQLRSASGLYRWCEPWIDELAAAAEAGPTALTLERVQNDLIGAGESNPWKPSEFIARNRVEALLAGGSAAAAVGLIAGAGAGLLFGAAAYAFTSALSSRRLSSQASKRRLAIRRRLAAAIDLMALMMEVGASFQESLETVARDASQHPLGEELRRVLRDLTLGRPRREALKSFAERLGDEDTRETIQSVIEGEALGTPLADTMRTQAEQMRLKRSQWAEKAAEESKVTLVFPAMLIMAACLAIVVAPFVLTAMYNPPA